MYLFLIRILLQGIFVLSFINTTCNAHVIDTLYYNESWFLTNAKDAAYFRIASLDSGRNFFIGPFCDYFSSGQLLHSGNYDKAGKKTGIYISYHSNGKIYCTGRFREDKMDSAWNYYFTNGQLNEVVEFRNDDFSVIEFNDSLGNNYLHHGTGIWVKDFYENNALYILQGYFKDSLRDGIWLYKPLKGMTRCAETYNKGKMKEGESYEGKKLSNYLKSIFGISIFYPLELSRSEYIFPLKTLSKSNQNVIKSAYIGSIVTSDNKNMEKGAYRIVEQQPEFPGGVSALYNYLAENVTYPDSARKANIQGKVVAQFYINKDGSLSDITIIKGLGYGCDEEVIRVIKESGNWIPGKQNGKPVRVIMSLPVSFNLSNPSNK